MDDGRPPSPTLTAAPAPPQLRPKTISPPGQRIYANAESECLLFSYSPSVNDYYHQRRRSQHFGGPLTTLRRGRGRPEMTETTGRDEENYDDETVSHACTTSSSNLTTNAHHARPPLRTHSRPAHSPAFTHAAHTRVRTLTTHACLPAHHPSPHSTSKILQVPSII